VVKDGRLLFDKQAVKSAKIVRMDTQTVRFSCRVAGSYQNTYNSEFEINLRESTTIDSDCDCSHKYDCQHLSASIHYLEEHFEEMIVKYSKELNVEDSSDVDEDEKATLLETFKEAESKEVVRRGKKYQKELLHDYIGAARVLGSSPFCLPDELLAADKAELAIVLSMQPQQMPELQLALRLPFRSKPLNIPNVREFFDAISYGEPLYIGAKRYFFSSESFDPFAFEILRMLIGAVRPPVTKSREEPNFRSVQIDLESLGTILACVCDSVNVQSAVSRKTSEEEEDFELVSLPYFYFGSLEEPLRFSAIPAQFRFELEYIELAAPRILLKPEITIQKKPLKMEEICLFECVKPGVLYKNIYCRFQSSFKRTHLRNISAMRSIVIPEPLFGTFVENSLPELMRFAEVSNRECVERFVTLPFVGKLGVECNIEYLDGEMEASLYFVYGSIKVPASAAQLSIEMLLPFVTKDGVLARNLTEEQKIVDDLFQDFIYDPTEGVYKVKNDKKIIEFMTEVIPRNQHRVKFNCPENLLDQFIYDNTRFKLALSESKHIGSYVLNLKIDGYLEGVTVDQLWECISARKPFIELAQKTGIKKKGEGRYQKILILDLDKLVPLIQIFDEIGIKSLDNYEEERPLWSLVNIDNEHFKGLPIVFSMTDQLKEIQQQMLGNRDFTPQAVPSSIKATLRNYQIDGISWMERLRQMHLNGILADDMGLGKTLQAITAVTQYQKEHPDSLSIIICPTSLVYNWKEEFTKFNPRLKVLALDGTPQERKKLLNEVHDFDIVITSYNLMQKDVDIYKKIHFAYAILDEAQHIKNRGTRNAKSVKMIKAKHRLILTGTPIENSLDELWSLFDFLMPGLLSSYDRFVEKYIRHPGQERTACLEVLRRKVSPFILRRMKKDVITELPPVSEITYHCHLSGVQKDLYHSYAQSAREELSQMVKSNGFEKMQLHVLATLTRLKQICCHPAIFAKENPELGDSAKYDMLMELLPTLIEGNHKVVIFSQYTRMLGILRNDLKELGIPFEYLDGSSKNRIAIVKRFNEDPKIPVFLVSLKAGGTGLNLVGADVVIHYDMWWNPAVENQATDRVHRIGQKKSVSSYKLVTLNTIEEKIIEMQNRKKGIVKEVINCDEEVISKLTWEEVLELLKT